MATGECCDRIAIGQFLEALLAMMAKSITGLNSLVTEHAEEMGLESLGVLKERPEEALILAFPLDNQLRIKWDEVDIQLATIGKPTGLYMITQLALMGIRGDNGDILIRFTDIQQRRLNGVLRYLKDTPVLPIWFRVEAKLRFRDFGPVYEVVSIDSVEKSWIASDNGDLVKYPLDEVAKYWHI